MQSLSCIEGSTGGIRNTLITSFQDMLLDRSFRIDLTPDQVVELTKQLPDKKKHALLKAFERERALDRLKVMMEALKDVDIDEETIRKEVDAVRAKRYAARKKNSLQVVTHFSTPN